MGEGSMRRCVMAVAAALLVAIASRSLSAKPHLIVEQAVEDWTLTVIADDSSDYAVCSIDRFGDSTMLLSVRVERPTRQRLLALSELEDDKPFKVGGAYSVTYSIDDGGPVAVRADAIGTRTVAIPLDDALTQSLRRGNRIAFLARQGGAATFSLAGSARALAALQDCVTRHLGFAENTPSMVPDDSGNDRRAANANPFAPADGGPTELQSGESADSLSETLTKTLETTSSPAVEATLVGEIFLQEANLSGYAENVDPESDDRIDGYDATWILPKARIGFAVVKDPSTSADAMLSGMSDALQEACGNEARVERPDGLAPGMLGRLHVYCRDAPPALFILFLRPRGGMYLLTVHGDRGREARAVAERYDNQIADVLIRRASQ